MLLVFIHALFFIQAKQITIDWISICFIHFSQDRRPLQVTVAVDGKSYKFKHSLEDMENGSCPGRKPSIQQRKRKQTLASRLKPLFSKRARKDKPNVLQAVKQRFRSEKGVHYLDQYSRILFPLGYAGFLTIYFVIYMKN